MTDKHRGIDLTEVPVWVCILAGLIVGFAIVGVAFTVAGFFVR